MTAPTSAVRLDCDSRGVATLTLDRPDKGNAYDGRMLEGLADGIARVSADAGVRALVLRGSGRHFGVGGDVLGDPQAIVGREDGGGVVMPTVCLALDACPKPTIALVHGACMGGAFALAACCDVLLAADDASFAVPELRLGFPVAPYLPFFERALGARALRRLLITGERIGAEEALRLGVAHRICSAAAIEQQLENVIGEVLLSAPAATAVAKQDLRELSGRAPTAELMDTLREKFRRGFEASEGVEGRASFRDRRPPAWAPQDRKPKATS
ncbi:MAG: enoyl-CoA hydratase/isomerase family protein [Rhodoplanes sp.]|uniref:enoyl-CoA hydratase/isomerase family protein n=1 Tax=Rhodoplanes sp. TaxID=1968906 RepID=UPI0018005447|nr:enoyl-CoA hydratase-related protein [Rhodoplanes sp.]NVO14980.1 enoyl-CoA hydratase/isomerase family protein [Rhodoplanes sp.]